MDTTKANSFYERLTSLVHRPDFKDDKAYWAAKTNIYWAMLTEEPLSDSILTDVLSYLSDYRPIVSNKIVEAYMKRFCDVGLLREYGNVYSFCPANDRKAFLGYIEEYPNVDVEVYDISFKDTTVFFKVRRKWLAANNYNTHLMLNAMEALRDTQDMDILINYSKKLSLFAQRPSADPYDIINLMGFISDIPLLKIDCIYTPSNAIKRFNVFKFNILCKKTPTPNWRTRMKNLLDLYIPGYSISSAPGERNNTEILTIENPCEEPVSIERVTILEGGALF